MRVRVLEGLSAENDASADEYSYIYLESVESKRTWYPYKCNQNSDITAEFSVNQYKSHIQRVTNSSVEKLLGITTI